MNTAEEEKKNFDKHIKVFLWNALINIACNNINAHSQYHKLED